MSTADPNKDELRAALDEADRGESVTLTAEELRGWAETGTWPARLDEKMEKLVAKKCANVFEKVRWKKTNTS